MKKLFGLGKDVDRSVRDASPQSFDRKLAQSPAVMSQGVGFRPPGTLAMGATPATLLLSIGSAMLGASGLLWRFGRGA